MSAEDKVAQEVQEPLKPLLWIASSRDDLRDFPDVSRKGNRQEMKAAQKATSMQESSGNVFADLGLRNPQDALAKAELAHQICQVIAARRLTQTKAAEIMGLDQPKISALMRGKLKGFSTERLFRCLNDLGQEVEITIRPARHPGCRGDVRVVTTAM